VNWRLKRILEKRKPFKVELHIHGDITGVESQAALYIGGTNAIDLHCGNMYGGGTPGMRAGKADAELSLRLSELAEQAESVKMLEAEVEELKQELANTDTLVAAERGEASE
jgi:hypothetical protein